MFKRVFERAARPIELTFEGEPVAAHEGDTVAAALLGAGHVIFRSTAISGAARGPFCMMGACFECLVEIDGAPNRQACMAAVAHGMRVRRMRGARGLGGPVLEDADQ
ncbi:MAG: (2Fe-2S)-binding protein [Gammaproteobacteria bacterium]